MKLPQLNALYRDIAYYPEPHGKNLRWLLRDYCRYVIKYSWPIQRRGEIAKDSAHGRGLFKNDCWPFSQRRRLRRSFTPRRCTNLTCSWKGGTNDNSP